jgi:hypothetical protein
VDFWARIGIRRTQQFLKKHYCSIEWRYDWVETISIKLLGSTAPHENSADLVAAAKRANEEGTKFDLDKLWDKPEHPEYWYFRSDHVPYAQRHSFAILY